MTCERLKRFFVIHVNSPWSAATEICNCTTHQYNHVVVTWGGHNSISTWTVHLNLDCASHLLLMMVCTGWCLNLKTIVHYIVLEKLTRLCVLFYVNVVSLDFWAGDTSQEVRYGQVYRLMLNITDLSFNFISAFSYKPLSGKEVSTPCQGCGSLSRMGSWLWMRTLWQKVLLQGHLLATRSWSTLQAMRLCQATSSSIPSSWSSDGTHTLATINKFGNTIEVTTRLISSPCLFLFIVSAPPTCMILL